MKDKDRKQKGEGKRTIKLPLILGGECEILEEVDANNRVVYVIKDPGRGRQVV